MELCNGIARRWIAQETNRHALHLAEVLKMGLKDGNGSQDVMYPERQFVAPRETGAERVDGPCRGGHAGCSGIGDCGRDMGE